ncbi:hypothetical protein GCK32_013941 [Trichostrongylus colubriformis]|uniref:Uncharacterized protein n=1 Tax=Trichostrongylus colubriformis TaxID=6319 RepID=A0AAN8F3A4_TRICO
MGTCIIASAGLLYELLNGMKGSLLYFITYLVAYNSVAVSWEPNYLGAAELMPTEVRAKTTASLNIISRVSNVIAARTVGSFKGTSWEPATLVVVLGSNIFSFIITFLFLKETKNIKLDAIGSKRDVEEGSTEVSKSSAETPVSKDTVPKDESKGESEVKEDIGSADKVESDAENRTVDARSQSDEGEMYNKVTEGIPKPFKTTEEKTSEEEPKASKEEPKASREEPKVPKEEPKASKEEPKVSKGEPKASKEEPKASKEEPKVSKEEPKASKEEPQASKEGSKASMVESKEGPKQSQERVSGDK